MFRRSSSSFVGNDLYRNPGFYPVKESNIHYPNPPVLRLSKKSFVNLCDDLRVLSGEN
jgi:hypothetical protein